MHFWWFQDFRNMHFSMGKCFFGRRPLPFGGSPLEAYRGPAGPTNHHRQSVRVAKNDAYQLTRGDTYFSMRKCIFCFSAGCRKCIFIFRWFCPNTKVSWNYAFWMAPTGLPEIWNYAFSAASRKQKYGFSHGIMHMSEILEHQNA